MEQLSGWQNFNVIVGSSAGALIGLQFVLLTLLASRPLQQMEDASAAFGTPTVVHFSVVLFLASIGSVPWTESTALTILWGIVSVLGMFYTYRTTRRMFMQTAYNPVVEDWMFHAILPFVSYALMAVATCTSYFLIPNAPFVGGAAMLILLFTGIHNSWDAVTYSVFKADEETKAENAKGPSKLAENENNF